MGVKFTGLFFFIAFLSFSATAQEFEGMKKINGTELFVSVHGKGKTIVMLHGGPGLNHAYFRPHLDELVKNYRIVYYDQRACGRSLVPSPDSISIKHLVNDLEALRKQLNVERLNLLGHSWGAVLATHYAIAYPERVESIIYSNPAMLSREYDQEAARITGKKTSKTDSLHRAQIFGKGQLAVADYDALMHLSFRTSAHLPENMEALDLDLPSNFTLANKALFGGLMKDPAMHANLYDSLNNFRFPVLIIHGHSDVIPYPAIERLNRSIPGSKLIVLNRSGHFPFVEEREKYLAEIRDFMKH